MHGTFGFKLEEALAGRHRKIIARTVKDCRIEEKLKINVLWYDHLSTEIVADPSKGI